MFCRKQQQSTNTVQNNVRSFTANRHRVIRSLVRYVKVSLSERPSLSQLLIHVWKATPCSLPPREPPTAPDRLVWEESAVGELLLGQY